LETFYKEFLEHLKIECLGCLKKHLGVWWEWKIDPDTIKVYLRATMPKMLKEIKEAYVNATRKGAKTWNTPGYPGKMLHRATKEELEVKSTQYQSTMGKLMYYMTKVAPECKCHKRAVKTND